ncbi:MAG: cytochrome P450 [Deltaproteobacteria bacterium]|nr:cytochrome P450 [Deltaproteobacteria bacterium]
MDGRRQTAMTVDPRNAPEQLWAPLNDPAFWAGDPAPHFARLRREAPVLWNPAFGYWALAHHADVMTVSRDAATFCSSQGILATEIGVTYPFPPTTMHTDAPEHSRYRELVQPGFAPRVMRALETRVRTRAAAFADRLAAGTAVDFAEAVAIPFPVAVICDLLGLDHVDDARVLRWSDAAIPGSSPMTQKEIEAAREDQRATLLAATIARRGADGDDLTTALANAEIDGDRLSDDEILMFQNQLLVAGNETTRNMISGGMAALATRPETWARLRAEPALVASAVEEWLRWTTPVISFMRTATRATELGGVPIAAGEPVLMLYASANRDESVFGPTADEFHVDRTPNPHVAFGFGPHFCLGAALARLEGRALLDELLERFATVELAGEVVRTESPAIAGIRALPLLLR